MFIISPDKDSVEASGEGGVGGETLGGGWDQGAQCLGSVPMITDNLRSWFPSLPPLQLLKNKQTNKKLPICLCRIPEIGKWGRWWIRSIPDGLCSFPCPRCSLHARRKKKTELSFYFQPDPCSLVLEKTVFRKHVPQYPLCKSLTKQLI